MSAIRVIKGVYRNKPVRNIAFNLVSGFQTGAKGNFVTVENNGAFPNCPDTIRIKVNNISDIEYVNGEAVSKENTVAFVAPQAEAEAETEEQIMTRIRERFDILHEMTKALVNGDIRAMIVSGPPGVGKSFGVEEVLAKDDLFDMMGQRKPKYEIVKGAMSAIGLYSKLYKYSDPKSILVFDDCDSILLDDVALNILKAALDSSKKRTISWNTDSRVLRSEGVPDKFDFKGGAIFITNLKFENVRSKKLQEHLAALESRCHYIDLRMDTDREKVLRIKQIVKDGMLNDYELTDIAQDEVVEFIVDNRSTMRELSLRTVLKVADLRKSFPNNWQNMARVTVMKGAY